MEHDKKKQLIIAILVIVVFGGIALASILLSKKEAKTGFEHNPLNTSLVAAQTGILLQGEGFLQWIDPMKTDKPEIKKLDAQVSVDHTGWANGQYGDFYKVSPDGKFLAVLKPDGNADPSAEESKIIIYNLENGNSNILIKANQNDMIASMSWDFSSKSICFITTKKVKTVGQFPFDVFTGSSQKRKFYATSASLFDSKTETVELPMAGIYYDDQSVRLLASNGKTFYIFDKGNFITVSSDVTKDNTTFDDYYDIKLYNSADYKSAIVSSYSKTIVYDLEKKEKKIISTNASNDYAGAKITDVAFSPDKKGFGFIKSIPKKTTNNNTPSLFVNTLWYFDFASQKYVQIFSKEMNQSATSLSYDSTTGLAISPDGAKIALISNSAQNNQPVSNYSVEIYPIAENSAPIALPIGSEASRILRWQ